MVSRLGGVRFVAQAQRGEAGMFRTALNLVLALLLVIGAAACVEGNGGTPPIDSDTGSVVDGTETTVAEDDTTTTTGGEAEFEAELFDVSDLVEQVSEGVVSVTSSTTQLDFTGTPQEVPAGAGTGIVVDDSGLILTNAHVIQQATSLVIVGQDGRRRVGELVAESVRRDLALVQVEDFSGLTAIAFSSLDDIEVGEPAVAIGNALGLDVTQPTVSIGIVSAIGRTIRTPNGLLGDLIQTDAAINPGNSGGPLLDSSGRLIGVNTAVAGGIAQNVGFAISVDTAKRFLDLFVAGTGEPYIGVVLVDNSPAAAAQLGLETESGVLIADIEPGSPAARAGLQRWDVVTAVDGRELEGTADLSNLVFQAEIGEELMLDVIRRGESIEVAITPEERPEGL
jgi:S1-C subfamily serine protease